ncbi:hypothetical protein JXA47_15565 [Candidatus Sumerlaeota bacterium]|nr:hypothetical protein [Candidatus Sumerlaeota bacterium]
MGTAFTYQGRLNDLGSPATGTYDLTLSVYASSEGGVAIAGPVIRDDVLVSGGLFAAPVDFGPGVFDGEARWMEIGVRDGAASGPFTTLSPRQELKPVPYALTTSSVVSGTIDNTTIGENIPSSGIFTTLLTGTLALEQTQQLTLQNGDTIQLTSSYIVVGTDQPSTVTLGPPAIEAGTTPGQVLILQAGSLVQVVILDDRPTYQPGSLVHVTGNQGFGFLVDSGNNATMGIFIWDGQFWRQIPG